MHFVIQATLGCFSRPAAAGLARPVSIQIWALRSRLEKPPTDPASAGGGHHCMPDGALVHRIISRRHTVGLKRVWMRGVSEEHIRCDT